MYDQGQMTSSSTSGNLNVAIIMNSITLKNCGEGDEFF